MMITRRLRCALFLLALGISSSRGFTAISRPAFSRGTILDLSTLTSMEPTSSPISSINQPEAISNYLEDSPYILNSISPATWNAWKGSLHHLAVVAGTIPLLGCLIAGMTDHASLLSILCVCISAAALVVDNVINAMGHVVGEGSLLRQCTKVRLMAHSLSLPLLGIPLIEKTVAHGILPEATGYMMGTVLAAAAMMEALEWFHFDAQEFQLVDNRQVEETTNHYLEGVVTYSIQGSNKAWKCILPCIGIVAAMITAGHHFAALPDCQSGSTWLMAGGSTVLASSAVRKPLAQMWSELAMVASLIAAVNAL